MKTCLVERSFNCDSKDGLWVGEEGALWMRRMVNEGKAKTGIELNEDANELHV